jgi:hypothetical protein
VLVPLSVSVPLPFFVRAPVPEMILESVIESLRLKTSVPLLVIALLEEMEPVVPPVPIWSVPALMVVVPV